MSPSEYRLFATIVSEGSLSAAARAMRISPAMVSKRLAQLEDRLAARLIHRTTRRLSLTSAGEQFHADVIEILHSIERAEHRVAGMDKEPRGPLRVTVPTSFGRMHIAPHLCRFLDTYPKVELSFDLTDEVVDLLAERIDVALRITTVLPSGFQAFRLADNHRVLCASPGYLARHGTPASIEDLLHHRLLAANGQLPWHLAHQSKRRLIDGPSHVSTNSSEVVRELALSGAGIALRSLWDVDGPLRSGQLTPILPEWHSPEDLGIYSLQPNAPTPSPAADAFVQFVKSILEPLRWEMRR